MNKRGRAFFIAWIGVFFLAASCHSVPYGNSSASAANTIPFSGTNDRKDTATVTSEAVSASAGTLLAVPSKEQLKKNSMDSAILGYLETGSPDSIRVAVDRINADTRGMTDQNRIALAVAGELMKIVYPLEPVSWSIPSVPESGSYIGAIHSARMGVYDYNTGNSDFFSLVLPSLVLVISTTPGEYYADEEAILLKAAAMNRKSVLPSYFLALLSDRQGKTAAADDYYKTAWDLDSSCYPAGIGYARSLLRKGNGASAFTVAKILAARYPNSVMMNHLCAEAAFSQNDWNAADPYVLKALKAEPNNTSYLLMRARILIENKEYLKANSLLDAFATTNKTDKTYLVLRSRVIREWNKNLVSATSILQDAQRLYPDDIDVLLASAEVCYQTGQLINQLGGRDFVQQVLLKDSGNRTALALLENDYILSSDWTNAVKNGEALVSLYPADESRNLLLRAYLGSGQTSRAVLLSKSLYNVVNPADEITGLYLQSLVESGDTHTAAAVIASRLPNSSSSLKSLLYYYENKLSSDPDAKLASLRSSLLADPRNLQSLFAVYQWYMDKTDYHKAQYYLKQVIALDPMNKKYSQLSANLDVLLAR